MKERLLALLGGLKPEHVVAIAVAVTLAIFAFTYGGYAIDTASALAFVLWLVILVGIGFAVIPRSTLGTPALVGLGLIAGLTIFTAVSISWSDDAGLAYQRTIQMLGVLGIFTIVLLTGKRGEGRGWLTGITLGLGFIVFLAALSRFLPGIGNDAELTRELGSIIGGRLSWPLGYWNAIGAVSASFLALCLWHGGHDDSERVRKAATAAIPVTAVVLYLCSSRGSLVALFLAIVLIIGLGPRRRRLIATAALGAAGSVPLVLLAAQLPDVAHAKGGTQGDLEGLLLLGATAVVCGAVAWARKPLVAWVHSRDLPPKTVTRILLGVGALALLLIILSDPVERISSFTTIPWTGVDTPKDSTFATSHLLSESGNGRWQLWESAINAFESQPVRGIGSGGFEAWFNVDGAFWMKTVDAHSMPIQVLAELGLAGFLLLIGFVGAVVTQAVRRYRELGRTVGRTDKDQVEMVAFMALLLVGAVAVSIDWSGDMPAIYGPIVAGAALLLGPVYAAPATARKMAPAARYAAMVAVILFSGAAMLASEKQYESTRSIASSRSAFDAGDGDEAIKAAERAISSTPWAGAAYAQLATVQKGTGDMPAALASAITATEKSPNNDSYWLLRSEIQTNMHLYYAAINSAVKARGLNPNSAFWLDHPDPYKLPFP